MSDPELKVGDNFYDVFGEPAEDDEGEEETETEYEVSEILEGPDADGQYKVADLDGDEYDIHWFNARWETV